MRRQKSLDVRGELLEVFAVPPEGQHQEAHQLLSQLPLHWQNSWQQQLWTLRWQVLAD